MRPRDPLRRTFGSAAEGYDAARPSYPPQLFDDLVDVAAIEPGELLLEIGCGTGKATRPLLERGFSVVCIELGSHLAEQVRRNLAGLPIEVHVAEFEEWPGQRETFDLVYAATAWHWPDPTTRYERAHELLRPDGHLAFWSALHAFPADFDPFFAEIQDVYDAIGEGYEGEEFPPPLPEQVPDESADIEASDLFEDLHVRRYVWATLHMANEYIAFLNTSSDHIAMEATKRERLYAEMRTRSTNDPTRACASNGSRSFTSRGARVGPPGAATRAMSG